MDPGNQTRYFVTLVLCAFISASVINIESLPSHRNVRAAGCRLMDGRTVNDGDNFTLQATGPCVFYLCQDGNILPGEYMCLRGNQCYPLNDEYTIGCMQRRCQLINGRFDYVVSKEGCAGQDMAHCVDINATVKDGCFEYRCEKELEGSFLVVYHLRTTNVGCHLNGQCVPLNYTHTQNCRTMRCEQHSLSVGFYPINDACLIKGECVELGSSHTDDECYTRTCTEQIINGVRLLTTHVTQIRCKGSDSVCYEPGSFYPIDINNKRVNCTCQVEGLDKHIDCPS